VEAIQLSDWLCPACNSNSNSLGIVFSRPRGIALHVAGKIKTGDHTHSQWARKNINEDIYRPEIYKTINTLASVIEPKVIEINNDRNKREEERMQRIIEERDANEEPKVLAYKHITYIENQLHQCVCRILKESYGHNEDEWWVKGISSTIRVECAKRREESTPREELFSYTDLIHLKIIIEKNRSIFEPRLLSVHKRPNKQKEFLDGIARCNDIRNRVMHTIRSLVSTEDISFLKQFRSLVTIFVK
jgi:hypothetical protein